MHLSCFLSPFVYYRPKLESVNEATSELRQNRIRVKLQSIPSKQLRHIRERSHSGSFTTAFICPSFLLSLLFFLSCDDNKWYFWFSSLHISDLHHIIINLDIKIWYSTIFVSPGPVTGVSLNPGKSGSGAWRKRRHECWILQLWSSSPLCGSRDKILEHIFRQVDPIWTITYFQILLS